MTEPLSPAAPASDRQIAWWERVISYFIIAWSAAFVLMPSVRSIQPVEFAAGVLFIVWCARLFLREKRTGLLGMSPAQLYQRARGGRRLHSDPLETATIAAYGLTIVVRMYAVWP